MSFTFNYNTDLLLSQVRALIPDVTPPGIFSDADINQFLALTGSQGIFASPQLAPMATSINNTPLVYSVRLAAAMGCDILAGILSQRAVVEQVLDIKLDYKTAAKMMADNANRLREQEQLMGHFAIAEIVVDAFSGRERILNQLLRVEGS